VIVCFIWCTTERIYTPHGFTTNIMNTASFITLDRVSKSYRRGRETLAVLKELSLEIAEGEFVALMGPSGSGKTTLLNVIAGLDKVDSGTITVDKDTLNTLSPRQLTQWRSRHVGFIFQFYNLLPVLSALENVTLPLALFSMSAKEQRERAMFALEAVGLADRMNHFPSELSGGQEQRVAIARAIVTDPTIIVADEPTGDLDRTSAREIMELFQRLHREFKKNVLMVTHDLTTAQYASRHIFLDKGLLISADEFLAHTDAAVLRSASSPSM
jgi:putative ABC transport system ATP-binding protein